MPVHQKGPVPAFAAFALALLFSVNGRAQTVINGLGDGSALTRNSESSILPFISGGVLTLTDGGFGESRSAFFNIPVPILQFTVQFTFQATGSFLADGTAFVMQNDPLGASALGGGGGLLGYNGITNSAAYEINVYDGHTIGTNLATNGAWGNYNSTGDVSLTSGHQIQFTLTYNGTTFATTLRDLSTNAQFSTSYSLNLASIVGGNTAYIGFTGATGAAASTQTVRDFSFSSAVPEPSTAALATIGLLALTALHFRRRV
jgi:hypothetical protein